MISFPSNFFKKEGLELATFKSSKKWQLFMKDVGITQPLQVVDHMKTLFKIILLTMGDVWWITMNVNNVIVMLIKYPQQSSPYLTDQMRKESFWNKLFHKSNHSFEVIPKEICVVLCLGVAWIIGQSKKIKSHNKK